MLLCAIMKGLSIEKYKLQEISNRNTVGIGKDTFVATEHTKIIHD